MHNRKPPQWFTQAVFYEIYPQTFFDSNGDGIGDIPGMIAKLDYIESLGITGIWLNPCFDSPFNDAGYDVRDYYKVAPRYGTNQDLQQFVQQAHGRGIRVILDLVPGHTSIDHPWFLRSAESSKNEFTNRYIWTSSVWEKTFDFYMESVRGFSARNAKYMANFFYTQPALNYGFAEPNPNRPWQLSVDHPAVLAQRDELLRIIRFWLNLGVDGFRVDMAYSLVKNDPERIKTIELWQWVREHLDREFPDAVLIAEWHGVVEALSAHFDACFVLPFDPSGLATFRNPRDRWSIDYTKAFFHHSGQGTMQSLLLEVDASLSGALRGFPAFAVGNHDVMRINNGRSVGELEIIHAFVLLMPGVPFIYYGDELGMADSTGIPSVEGGYERTSARTPMQWTLERNAGFSTASEERLYTVPCSWDQSATVEAQDQDPDSLLNRIRRLISLVKQEPAFHADGAYSVLHGGHYEYPLVFTRSAGNTCFVIVMNPSGKPTTANVSIDHHGIQSVNKISVIGDSSVSVHLKNGHLNIMVPAESYAVFSACATSECSDRTDRIDDRLRPKLV